MKELKFASLVQICRILYYRRPAYQAEYLAKKKEQHINAIDERKQLLRAKAGQIMYQIMAFALFILQWAAGVIVYRILEKRM